MQSAQEARWQRERAAEEDRAFTNVFCDAALDTILAMRPETIRQGETLLSHEVRIF